ncbi:hypothetical protein WOSG25_090250 [Weissella oryzae SG25]|uniref:Uncharacterized protein n=1 Tax=Weissella oryzae (strain DSM 25784 / JCM 18191 / LMG 30913 / SG25) TaxID=1329250 RepID=A0A069CVV0_WEIOS|nr:hypothetical protein [Weissella oryzae]GAK31328.1 hypothetical protein WOSG25_090250 [Weissella oryzae SG25]
MDIVIKLIGVIGGVVTVLGLIGLLTGYQDFSSGRKNDNPSKMEQGINAMIFGGVQAAIAAGVVAAIVAALNNIKF